MTITPDTKDWTWVLSRPCGECGFDATGVSRDELVTRLRENTRFWQGLAGRGSVHDRPEPDVWSPAEYACHVRDVHRIFGDRLALMLIEDDPLFDNWDQDETAVAQRYDLQRADVAVDELVAAAEAAATAYAGVAGEQWDRSGRRSNGSIFTVETLGLYHLHDIIHHRWDLRRLEA